MLHEHRIRLWRDGRQELLNNDGLIPIATDSWPTWYRELVHEMLHEYQFRALNQQATPEGAELHTAHHQRFPGPGHNAVFFTAIARWAHYFDLMPEQLVENFLRKCQELSVLTSMNQYEVADSNRVTAIIDLLTNKGVPLEDVQYLAGHTEPLTTGLYDRRKKQVTRSIVERISIRIMLGTHKAEQPIWKTTLRPVRRLMSSSATLTRMRGCGRSSKHTSARCGGRMSLLVGMIAKSCRVLNGKIRLIQHIETSQIILLLVSAEFLNSDYCYDVELKRAIARHDAGDARVVPIILRPCDWLKIALWKTSGSSERWQTGFRLGYAGSCVQ